MNNSTQFGLFIPAFPVTNNRGTLLPADIVNYLTALEGQYTSAWMADHFVPWHPDVDMLADTLECWTGLTYLAGKFERDSYNLVSKL